MIRVADCPYAATFPGLRSMTARAAQNRLLCPLTYDL
jgi:hypothetical protein